MNAIEDRKVASSTNSVSRPGRKPYLALLVAGLAALDCYSPASAHSIAGNRVFPATLGIDDPGVSDELALPTYTYIPEGDDGVSETSLSFEFAKRITPDLALSVGDEYTRLGSGEHGFGNVELGLKYQAYVNPEHEFMVSLGLEAEIGGTGAEQVDADPFTTFTPTVYFGKGFGDLPDSVDFLRPFALTGAFGYGIPSQSSITEDDEVERNANVLEWGFTLQYSLPYLNANVHQIDGPEFLKHLVPIVEASFETPVGNTTFGETDTTGTIQPGLIYMADSYQVALEAVIPINNASGRGIGVTAELHFFLDDILPNSLGKPIFQ